MMAERAQCKAREATQQQNIADKNVENKKTFNNNNGQM